MTIVWLASYPRSGNTLLRCIFDHCFNIQTTSIYGKNERVSLIVNSEILGGPWSTIEKSLQNDSKLHIVKTHNKKPNDYNKTIYIVRDGRASIHSYHSFLKDFENKNIPLNDVIKGLCNYGSWSNHISNWIASYPPQTNILLLRYEDIISNSQQEIEKISDFLNIPIVNKWDKTFEEYHNKFPLFFKVGNNNKHIDLFSKEELELFWFYHNDWMNILY